MAGNLQAANGTRYAWYVLAVLTFINIVAAVDRFIMAILVVPLKGAMGLTDFELGLLQGLGFAILYSVAGLPLGLIADRLSRRWLVTAGCFAWTIATAACAFTNTFDQLFVGRIFVGLGEASLFPAAISLLGAYFPRDWLGRANGVYVSGASIGKALAFIVGGALLTTFAANGGVRIVSAWFQPWQALFLIAAMPGILATLLAATLKDPIRPAALSRKEQGLGDFVRYVAQFRAAFILYVLAAVCTATVGVMFLSWAPSFFVRRFGVDIAQAAWASGLVSLLVSPVGAFAGGYLTDRMSRAGVESAPLVVVAVSLLLLIPAGCAMLLLAPNFAASVACYILVQPLLLAAASQAYAGTQMITPERHRGIMSALLLAAVGLGSMGLGPGVIGFISDRLSGDANGLGVAVASSASVCCLLGAVICLLARRPAARLSASELAVAPCPQETRHQG